MQSSHTSSAHSTGPWSYRKPSEPVAHVAFWIDDVEGGPIADVKQHDPERIEADARLIAAAPELLKLARQYASDCDVRIEILSEQFDECPDDDIQDQIDHWQATKKQVESVIAKAEGRA